MAITADAFIKPLKLSGNQTKDQITDMTIMTLIVSFEFSKTICLRKCKYMVALLERFMFNNLTLDNRQLKLPPSNLSFTVASKTNLIFHAKSEINPPPNLMVIFKRKQHITTSQVSISGAYPAFLGYFNTFNLIKVEAPNNIS